MPPSARTLRTVRARRRAFPDPDSDLMLGQIIALSVAFDLMDVTAEAHADALKLDAKTGGEGSTR